MSKNKANKKPKIVIVNSFKGGAGKTSTALSLALSSSIQGAYEDNYYLDIDILGTGMFYTFFSDDKPNGFHFFSEDIGENLENVFYYYEFKYGQPEQKNYALKVALSETSMELGVNSGGKIRKSKPILEYRYIGRILNLINKIHKLNKNSLIVIDCSPGLSSFEVGLLTSIYEKYGEIFDIKEVYITTPDSAHVKKTIFCLTENLKCCKYLFMRKPIIVINDNNGFEKLADYAGKEILKDTADGIQNQLSMQKLNNIKVIIKNYNENILKNNAYNKRVVLNNNIDTYKLLNAEPLFEEVINNAE